MRKIKKRRILLARKNLQNGNSKCKTGLLQKSRLNKTIGALICVQQEPKVTKHKQR